MPVRCTVEFPEPFAHLVPFLVPRHSLDGSLNNYMVIYIYGTPPELSTSFGVKHCPYEYGPYLTSSPRFGMLFPRMSCAVERTEGLLEAAPVKPEVP